MTAPTGTSPASQAFCAWSRAWRIACSSDGVKAGADADAAPGDASDEGSVVTSATSRSFPLDGGRRLGRHVVGDAVDAAHLVDDAARDFLQQPVGQLGPVGGHEVAGL